MQSFLFLDDKFILASTCAPPALLVYKLKQTAADDTTHLLHFLLGIVFRSFDTPNPNGTVLLASNPSPGCLPSTGDEVPFQIAGRDERMITMYSSHWDDWKGTFLIPARHLLRQFESLPGKRDLGVEWRTYGLRLHLESVPEAPAHTNWIKQWRYFVFGMRYLLPRVTCIGGKRHVIIRDYCPRRYLRASKEKREESNALEEAIKLPHFNERVSTKPKPYPYTQSILQCVPLPEYIRSEILVSLISEDGILVVEKVRYICCLPARLINNIDL